MRVTCDSCGQLYRLEAAALSGGARQFKCRRCGAMVRIGTGEADDLVLTADESLEQTVMTSAASSAGTGSAATVATKRGASLRAKMMVLFVALPIALMAAASIFYLTQLNALSVIITGESSKVAANLAETIISNKADAVADQVRIYADSIGETSAKKLSVDAKFRELAVQPIGQTGYTALYELPDDDGTWRTWAHVNEKIIGIDMATLEKPLGENFPGFWKVFTGVGEGIDSRGYYSWQDKDGTVRDKFMVCKVVPGTRMVVASTTYLDEFTRPVEEIRSLAEGITNRTRLFTAIAMLGTLVIIGFVVSTYGYRITGKIRELTQHASKISAGDLTSELQVKSRDEIGDLAEAIALMQASIRLSIARLSRR